MWLCTIGSEFVASLQPARKLTLLLEQRTRCFYIRTKYTKENANNQEKR